MGIENPKVVYIVADTQKANISSHKVLEKAGAVQYKETDELMWWRIKNKKLKHI